jgi:N6-L-threonylcarbamoyladenine synthase
MQDTHCLALSTRTQIEHDITGWVVPEVAARSHANAIFPCIEDVLREGSITLDQVDLIACTNKPGLLPSLITGMTVAKTLSLSLKKPIHWLDHIESHMFANLLDRNFADFHFPLVVLTVSGWHTEIYLWKSLFEFECIGQTRDDAAGEAYDKVSKMMGLGFPGGAKIAKLADQYRNTSIPKNGKLFPRSYLESDSLDFSFSGLKSAVKRYIDTYEVLDDDIREMIAYEFEEAVVEVLSYKLFQAAEKYAIKNICLAGWVSANTYLKQTLQANLSEGMTFFSPTKILYSQDNAAMVWIHAYYRFLSCA